MTRYVVTKHTNADSATLLTAYEWGSEAPVNITIRRNLEGELVISVHGRGTISGVSTWTTAEGAAFLRDELARLWPTDQADSVQARVARVLPSISAKLAEPVTPAEQEPIWTIGPDLEPSPEAQAAAPLSGMSIRVETDAEETP